MIEEKIRQAIETGTIVSMVYNGGSHAGQARGVIMLSTDGLHVRARAPDDRTAKSFLIAKIASVTFLETGETEKYAEPLDASNDTPLDLNDMGKVAFELSQLKLPDAIEVKFNGQSIELFKVPQNGIITKHPVLAMSQEKIIRNFLDFETGQMVAEWVDEKMHWHLSGGSLAKSKYFGSCQAAGVALLAEVRKL